VATNAAPIINCGKTLDEGGVARGMIHHFSRRFVKST